MYQLPARRLQSQDICTHVQHDGTLDVRENIWRPVLPVQLKHRLVTPRTSGNLSLMTAVGTDPLIPIRIRVIMSNLELVSQPGLQRFYP